MAFKSTDFKGHFVDLRNLSEMKSINSMEELRQEARYVERIIAEFFIMLNGGLRSSKRIVYFDDIDRYDVYNEIDDSYQEDLTEKQLEEETNIVSSIKLGAFFKYD